MNRMLLLLATTVLTSCSLAPSFDLPEMKLPEMFKEKAPEVQASQQNANWKEAVPLAKEDRGQWWRIFGDETLNDLEKQASDANNEVKAAAARVEQARGIAGSRRPSIIPDLDISANAVRAKPADASVAAFSSGPITPLKPYTLYNAGGMLSYEIDLFGRVRDNYRALNFDADAREAELKSILLSLQAELAQTYFSLRAVDSERAFLRNTVKLREEQARIMQKRFELGDVGEQDHGRAQNELASAQAELIERDRQRALLEHALAVLLGKTPEEFTLAEATLEGAPPPIPPGLPSELLERRPDVAAAIASMQAANKRIGVARAAFFPRLGLTATGGYESTDLGDLFKWNNHYWALGQAGGSALVMPIIDSGRNWSNLEASNAAYDEAVANYRQRVLVAFRDVEDNLVSQRLLADKSQQTDTAAAAAKRTYELTQLRYEQGDVDHMDLVSAERDALSAELAAIATRRDRFVTTVTLIRALGGGWKIEEAAQALPESKPTEAPTEKPALRPATAQIAVSAASEAVQSQALFQGVSPLEFRPAFRQVRLGFPMLISRQEPLLVFQ